MTEQAETNEAQNPLTKPKFIISAVVVALIVALGIILALLPKGSSSASESATPSSDTSSASTQTQTAAAASVCGLARGDQSKPAAAPADTKWELVGKIAAPTSPKQYGPGQTAASGLRSCFAQSPMGALYAAVNLTALSASGKAALVFEQLAVPGPERDAMLKETPSPVQDSVTAQVAGFAIRSYDSDQAVIDLAFKGDNGAFVSIPVPLRWYGGDWKFVVPASGSTGAHQIADLSGYVKWAGV